MTAFEGPLFEELGLPSAEIDDHKAAHNGIRTHYAGLHLDLMRMKSLRRVDVLRLIRRGTSAKSPHTTLRRSCRSAKVCRRRNAPPSSRPLSMPDSSRTWVTAL